MFKSILVAAVLLLLLASPQVVAAYERAPQRPAIVLAAFGTTDPEALTAILNVENKVKQAFPGYDVHLAFTSNTIRDKWHARANDKKFKKENPGIPAEMYEIKNPLTAMALIQEYGPRDIIVQSLHVTNGSEFSDLKSIVDNLRKISALQESLVPFPWIALGDSALGKGRDADLKKAASALEPLVRQAKDNNAALVFLGHGNEHFDTRIYGEFEKVMKKTYDYPIFVGLVEGEPGLDEVLKELGKTDLKAIVLSPLMLVAGDHAKNDMAGDDQDSWSSQFKAKGFTVTHSLKGLGLNEAWANIYVERIKELEAAKIKDKK